MTNQKIQEFTNKLIMDIENGKFEFQYNWNITGEQPQNFTSHHVYRGFNAFMLKYFSADTYFLTFLQAKEKGIKIKKGTEGHRIIYWKLLDNTRSKNIKDSKKIPLLRISYVFGLSQTDHTADQTEQEKIKIPTAEETINNYIFKPEILIGDKNPCYVPAFHTIYMPSIDKFKNPELYYSTLFHELAHSAKKELNIKRGNTSEDYAKEELIAEMSTAIICNYLGIETAFSKENSTAYLQDWIKHSKENPKYLMKIIEDSEKRFRLICFNEKPTQEEETTAEVLEIETAQE